MKNKKYIYLFLLIIFCLIVFLSVNINKNKTVDNNNLKITSTIFPYYSLAKELCGDSANIEMLLKPGTESHTFEPTAKYIMTIKNSDIFIYTGGESDRWVETILSSINTDKTKIIKLINYIEPLTNKHNEHISYDEHIWTSPINAKKILEIIYDTVCDIKPESIDILKENLNKTLVEIDNLDKQFDETIKSSNKTLIFADRFPFSYFANDYNLSYISAFTSCAEEAEPTVQAVTNIINTIKNQNIKYVFYIEFSNQKIADAISNETGTSKLLFHSCHNISLEDFKNDVSYISLMQNNLKNLKEAIK